MPFEVRKKCQAAADKVKEDPKEYRQKKPVGYEFIDVPFNELHTDMYNVDNEEQKLPMIIYVLMEFIKGKGKDGKPNLLKENSFRLNGNLTTKDQICLHLQLKNYDILKDPEQADNSHEICTLLKQVILELSEPLIPFATYDKILEKVKPIE